MSAADDGDRTKHWPAIERRYGRPISHWLDLMAEHVDARYPEQIALLCEDHGFSRSHANAVVMYARGSTTSSSVTDLGGYLHGKDPVGAATARAMLEGLIARHPGTTITFAWNQPFLTLGEKRLFSVSVMKAHLLAAPWSVEVLDRFRPDLVERGMTVNRMTFRLPADWEIDAALLDAIVAAELERPPTG